MGMYVAARIRRATPKKYSAEEKIRIVLEGKMKIAGKFYFIVIAIFILMGSSAFGQRDKDSTRTPGILTTAPVSKEQAPATFDKDHVPRDPTGNEKTTTPDLKKIAPAERVKPEASPGLTQMPEASMQLKKTKLEVREVSGGIEKWSHYIVRYDPQSLTFRWSTNMTTIKIAHWIIFEGNKMQDQGRFAANSEPGKWKTFNLDYFDFDPVPEGKHTYRVQLKLFDNDRKFIGWSEPVAVIFDPAANNTIPIKTDKQSAEPELKAKSAPKLIPSLKDDVTITEMLPKSTNIIYGPREGEQLNAENSIEIKYDYQLHSSEYGEIRQWALLQSGNVAPNNYWNWSSVIKGKGSEINRLTIKCSAYNQADTQVKGIKYILMVNAQGEPLVEKNQPVNYIFKCKKPQIKKENIQKLDLPQ